MSERSLGGSTVGKSGHDLKQAALVLATAGVALAGFDVDAMIASYVLDPGSEDMI